MSPRLIAPDEAARIVKKKCESGWSELVCAELLRSDGDPILTIGLHPGIDSSSAAERHAKGQRFGWTAAWSRSRLTDVPGVSVEEWMLMVQGVPTVSPQALIIDNGVALSSVLRATGASEVAAVLDRGREVGARLSGTGRQFSPSVLRAVCRLSDRDADVLIGAISWLEQHPDVSCWTKKQIPIPGIDTKWLDRHMKLLSRVSGRDLEQELRPHPAVVHLTYLDPDYRLTGERIHDAFTAGDVPTLAYRPTVVIVIENRESRLWFESFGAAIAVEGGGAAVSASLGDIEWLSAAERIFYWGDIDADGFAILHNFRLAMRERGREVESLLMDRTAWQRYRSLGVNHDRRGDPLGPCSTSLSALTADEQGAYSMIATSGDTPIRRVEQERIPTEDALRELRRLVGS